MAPLPWHVVLERARLSGGGVPSPARPDGRTIFNLSDMTGSVMKKMSSTSTSFRDRQEQNREEEGSDVRVLKIRAARE